jgi:Zn-dependent M32 family carboxypeptidase
MVFEQDIEALVSKGDYNEVRRLTTASFCPVATRLNSETLVKDAASHLIRKIVKQARKAEDFQAFSDAVKDLVDLAKTGSFPLRTKAGEIAVRLYSERMATDQIKRLSGSYQVPKSVVSLARRELKTCQLDSDFVSTRTFAPAQTRTRCATARV